MEICGPALEGFDVHGKSTSLKQISGLPCWDSDYTSLKPPERFAVQKVTARWQTTHVPYGRLYSLRTEMLHERLSM
jgi:hypothetical protein